MTWYQVVVYIHILSAIIWVGGIMFLALVAVPAARRLQPDLRATLLSELGRRFRRIGYWLLAVLVLTGGIQIYARGATLANLTDGSFFQSRFGALLKVKLLLFLTMLVVSITHDFFVGPASTRALSAGEDTRRLRKTASWLARVTALLALAVVAYAVKLIR